MTFIANIFRVFLALWVMVALTAKAEPTGDAEAPRLLIPDVKPEFRVAQNYFTGLLQRALVLGADGRKVPLLLEQRLVGQDKAIQDLMRGQLLDVYWMGTNSFREQHLRAIKIPLTRGLMGYRRFIINKNHLEQFAHIHQLAQLQSMVACQGINWPDSLVLRSAGLRVREITDYEHIYTSLVSGVCDYFPRGFFEVDSELRTFQAQYPALTGDSKLLLHYPFAVYFFVNPKREDLALWIENGLERMIDSGEFEAFMHKQKLTASSFPLVLHTDWQLINIDNPDLPKDTNYRDSRYWFQPEDFSLKRP